LEIAFSSERRGERVGEVGSDGVDDGERMFVEESGGGAVEVEESGLDKVDKFFPWRYVRHRRNGEQ